MVTKITKERLEKTKDLAEAIKTFFVSDLEERLCLLDSEAMEGDIASAYNQLGLQSRRGTYKKIVTDFRTRTQYSEGKDRKNIILDVGCGSGLLSLELVEQTGGIVLGFDASEDMIRLANQNKARKAEEFVQKVIQEYQSGGYDFSHPIPAAYDPMPEIVDVAQHNLRRAWFGKGEVYDLPKLIGTDGKETPTDYIICRNVLHRLREPQKALEQMLNTLKEGGKIYLRDLKRNADWKTVISRIGEQRWKNPILVRDYIGAMASMLTTEELDKTLRDIEVKDYTIFDGSYKDGNEPLPEDNLNEFEKETEYVCVIQK